MYRQSEGETRETPNKGFGEMSYGNMMPQGMQVQMNGKPMMCYPMYENDMMYGNQMKYENQMNEGQDEGYYQQDMYRQHYGGMHYYHPRPRPYPYYHYYPRPRRPYFMYYNFFPFQPYYPYPYYYEDEEYGY
jgi:hypothetical protein